ncbi:MAG TPA: 3'-5' exonuclease, partial [Nitrospirota bacterium]|nr:3'-5' exonuclease [Nitrospirota bacterium]
ALGKFLKEEMIGKEIISDSEGGETPVSPRHIAILLPKLTQVHEYLDVLKRLRIPYIVEGDRHFYGTQEVIDFVNLLRVLDNPLDKTAMAGVLRSPMGGISDRELYELFRLSLDDYRIEDGRLSEGLNKLNHSGFGEKSLNEFKEQIQALYGLMKHLYINVSILPVPDAIHYIFDNSPVLELAASSYHGEQSVANLQKIYRIASAMSNKSSLTLKGLTVLLEKRVDSREKEGESLLSEEGVDAVRILSIHRAKGLEFPVVIVGGMQGTRNRTRDPATVNYDWSVGMTGISIGGISNHSSVMMLDKERLIEKEEQKRLLYVAMTRAKECLILSGVLGKRIYKDSFLSMLMETIGHSAGDSLADEITMEKGILKQTVIDYKSCAITEMPPRKIRMGDDRISLEKIAMLSDLWDRRKENYRTISDKPLFVTPSSVEKNIAVASGKTRKSENNKLVSAERSILIGNIAHYVLSNWDFALKVSQFKEAVEGACRKFIPLRHPEFISGSNTMSDQEIPKQVRDDGLDERGAVFSSENMLISVQYELVSLFEKFSASSVYQELKAADILGKEVPFSIPWNGQIMEGVIDIIYRCGDKLYAADYKTDRVSDGELESKVEEYSVSSGIYMNAVRICTGSDLAEFKLIFLRQGKSVKV